MTRSEVIEAKQAYIDANIKYCRHWWQGWSYNKLRHCTFVSYKKGKNHKNESYSDLIIFADTETSKSHTNTTYTEKGILKYNTVTNYVVIWTITLRIYGRNLVTLYGHSPRDFCKCMQLILDNTRGDNHLCFFHNLSYDYTFLRRFLYEAFGEPVYQLATKPHYPVIIEFENGLTLRDSMILFQRSLEKTAKDLNVEHQKAVGFWDYEKIRNQNNQEYTEDELTYAEFDTLAGAECIEKEMELLNKKLLELPLTATGIPREQVRIRGAENKAHEKFKFMVPELEVQEMLEESFHGGFTHGNRHIINYIQYGLTQAYDFSSSYPFCMLSEKYPVEKFRKVDGNMTIDQILKLNKNNAFVFKLILVKPKLKDYLEPLPTLQFSKCETALNPILDNGRILTADYVSIVLNDIDLEVIASQYTATKHIVTDVHVARKEFLPKWFCDYIFSLYKDKTELKGVDEILYRMQKGTLNSTYGMCVQKPIKSDIQEDYATGDYFYAELDDETLNKKYKQYTDSFNSVLPFQWGLYVTSYAMRNLLLGLVPCAEKVFYCDTDSCYGQNWDMDKLNAYNESCKEKLINNGYECVMHNGREYWLGIAELDGEYTEFMVQHSKCYAGRSKKDGELHITVAGVPKHAASELKNDINNFRPGFIFSGLTSGKKTHTYNFVETIYTDERGNLIGDNIDLTPCDYKLNSINHVPDLDELLTEEIEVQQYE